jgi:hypothetical protein
VLTEEGARIAGLAAVVYFPSVYFSTGFASETLFLPLLGLALWTFLMHLRTRSLIALAIAGIALGWAALTRPFAVLIPPVWIGVLLWARRDALRKALAPAAILLCGFSLVVLPWTIRNYRVHGRFVLIATNGGSTFYGSNNDWAISSFRNYGRWTSTRFLPGFAEIAAKHDAERDRIEWRRGEQWVLSHWRWMPVLFAAKYVRLWMPDIDSANRKYVLLDWVLTTPFLLLILTAQFHMLRHKRWWSPKWLAIHGTGLATVAATLVTWGSPRFRDANATLLMVYAAVALLWIARRPEGPPAAP